MVYALVILENLPSRYVVLMDAITVRLLKMCYVDKLVTPKF